MKKNKKTLEISDEDFLLCLLKIASVTPEQQMAEWQSIIDNEIKKPITQRDYKTIAVCFYEKIKCKHKNKNKDSDNKILISRIVKTLEFMRKNKSEQ